MNMKMIRNYVYAALLALTALNFAPTLASAQELAHGKFTLTHEVHWGNAKLPAGDYVFSFDPDNGSRLLSLSKVSGTPASYMVLVPGTEDAKPSDGNRLVLERHAQRPLRERHAAAGVRHDAGLRGAVAHYRETDCQSRYHGRGRPIVSLLATTRGRIANRLSALGFFTDDICLGDCEERNKIKVKIKVKSGGRGRPPHMFVPPKLSGLASCRGRRR